MQEVYLMFSDERRQQISDILETQKFVHVTDLANRFFTSEATIRRDLDKLRKSGLLKRTYGGAVLLEGTDAEIPLTVREEERRVQKELIAQTAAQLIQMDAVMIIDSSSTCAKIIPHLASRKPKTVITNSPKTAIQLAQCGITHIYSTGGFLRSSSLSYVGEAARKMISSYYVDILFFSCRGASIDIGLTDPSEEGSGVETGDDSALQVACPHAGFQQIRPAWFCAAWRLYRYRLFDYRTSAQRCMVAASGGKRRACAISITIKIMALLPNQSFLPAVFGIHSPTGRKSTSRENCRQVGFRA